MAEIPAGGLPFRKDINARALKAANRGPSGVKGALLKVGAALGLVASGGAIEVTAHPIQNTIDTTRAAIEQGAHNVQQAKQDIVSLYNENAEVQAYNEQVASRLNGRTPLLEGEKIYEKVKVIPAGANIEELTKMQQERILVNVRDYPGTDTPKGQFSKIIGELPQGRIIEHAILVKGAAPNRTNPNTEGNWYGFLYKPQGAGENEPFKFGYIYSIYGQPESLNTATSSAPETATP